MTRNNIFIQSYGYSGGTLVGDFLNEFNNISYMRRREFDLFRGSGGIFEMGQLIEESSNYTKDSMIRRFYKLIDFLDKWGFVQFYGQGFRDLSMQFADSLIEQKSISEERHLSINERIRPPRNLLRPLYKLFLKEIREVNYDKDTYLIKKMSKEEYIKLAKKYLEDNFDLLPENNCIPLHHALIFDMKIDNQLPYFDDNFKVFIVDKDPRDIYVAMNKGRKVWSLFEYVDDIDTYIERFKRERQYEKHNMSLLGDKVMKVRCEDFVLNYDDYKRKILDFTGLKEENHTDKFKYFNPEVSIKYIGSYKNFENQDVIRKIEKELSEYIQ